MNKAAGIAVAAAVLALAGCGGSSTPATQTGASAPAHAAPSAAPGSFDGPLKITIDYCGALSTAQQNAYSTSDTAGMIVTATNAGHTAARLVEVNGEFTSGSTVVDTNPSGGGQILLAPGQSTKVEIDNVVGDGPGNPSNKCAVTGYNLDEASGFTQYGTN